MGLDFPGLYCCCGGPWVFYHDFDGGETDGDGLGVGSTMFIPRTGSLYDSTDNPPDSSHPDWSVEVVEPLFTEGKRTMGSLVAMNQPNGEEIVFVYIENGSVIGAVLDAWVGLDAVNETFLWLRFEADWAPDPEMGRLSIADSLVMKLPQATSEFVGWVLAPWDSFSSGTGFGVITFQSSQITTGVSLTHGIKWQPEQGDLDEGKMWTLAAADGTGTYTGWSGIRVAWVIANPLSGNAPQYSYLWPDLFFSYQGLAADDNVNELFYPFGLSPNGAIAVGGRRPHVYEDGTVFSNPAGLFTFEAKIELAVGPIAFDGDGYPFVDGDPAWEFTVEQYAGGTNTHNGNDIGFRVDGFDAHDAAWIALVVFQYRNFFDDSSGSWAYNGYESFVRLLINGTEVHDRSPLMADGPLVTDITVDNRDFFPWFKWPRVLAPSEGGGQLFIIFERYPFDASDVAADSLGSNDLVQWDMVCYNAAGVEQWRKRSAFTDVASAEPRVYTSSNRYLIACGFRMVLPEDAGVFYENWEISHDGLIVNPCRLGPRLTGTDFAPGAKVAGSTPDWHFDCVKQSANVRLSPTYGER